MAGKYVEFTKNYIPNDELIQGIKSGSPEVFKHLKLSCFPFVLKYIRSTNGTLKDAEEIFQDALIVVFKKLKISELQLSCQFNTYFISICKYIWTFKQSKETILLRSTLNTLITFQTKRK